MQVSRLTIPFGEPGTDATVRIMRKMIEAGKRDQAVRQLAERILRLYHVPNYQYVSELAALHDWVRRNVRYTKDPHEVEYIQTPRRLLQTRMGDCDDMAVLLGSLAEVVGHPVGIKVVSRYANRNYHHVYPVAEVNGREYGLDASVPFPFGYQSPDIKKEKVFPSNGVGDMRSVFYGLGKSPPVSGGDGAAAGDSIRIAFEPDVLAKVKVSVLGPGGRICGPDVLERMRQGTIRPDLPSTRLKYIAATESGAGVPCVIAQEVSVYERPIEPPVPGLPPSREILDVTAPITLRAGQRLCRPDVRTLFEQGKIKADAGTVLRFGTDAGTGTSCVAAVIPTDVKAVEKPTIFIPPPDVRKPLRKILNVGETVCRYDVLELVAAGQVTAAAGTVLVHDTHLDGRPCARAVLLKKVAEKPDIYRPILDAERRPAERPDVYMPAPIETIPPERRPGYEPTPYVPPGVVPAGVVESAMEEGPLGLPWVVWIGAAGLLVTVLMKK